MKRIVEKHIIFVLIALILIMSFSPCFANAEKKSVKVGFYEMNGYQNVDANGGLSGYAYDYINAVAQYASWDVDYVLGHDWSESLQMLEDGEIDLLCGVLKNDQREQFMEYPDLWCGVGYACLIVDENNSDVAFDDYGKFNNMRVGMAKNSARNQQFDDYEIEHGFSTNHVIYNTEQNMCDALSKGEVDAILTTSNLYTNGRIVAKFNPEPQYITVKKGNTELLDELNRALVRLKTEIPNFDDFVFSKNYEYQHGKKAVFSEDEINYVKSHKSADVLFDPNWFPLEGVSGHNGEAHGISIDILNRIADVSGLELNYVESDSFSDALNKFKSGQYEIFSAITYDFNWANENNMNLTQPYVDIPLVYIYKTEEQNKLPIALPMGYYISKYMEKSRHDVNYVYYDSVKECIEAVNAGKAQGTYANTYETEQYLQNPKFRSLSYRNMQTFSQKLSIAVAKDADPLLYSIISKSLISISDADIAEIIRVHTVHKTDGGFYDMIYTNPLQFVLITSGIIILIIIIFVVLFLNFASKRKNLALQKALAAKSVFLSNMSHDMRTPMNGILGLVELSKDIPALPNEMKSNLKGMEDSGKYLLQLINDTLDMTKIDSDKITIKSEIVNAGDMIENIKVYTAPLVKEKNINFKIETKGARLDYIKTDPLRLQQIFMNIISNAIKFTPVGGEIEFIVECLKRENGVAYDKLTVRDTGIGMSPEFLEHIFEPFEQEEKSFLPNNTGTGLGMSIVKRLVELMGGSIEVESESGVGTVVTVYLSFEKIYNYTEESDNNTLDLDILKGKHILLCEDHPLNATIAKKMLEGKGLIVEWAENGKLGVDSFSKSDINYYDAILMDIRMPIMDGLEATRQIRELNRVDSKTIPIIAMTANAFDDDVKKSREIGMNEHLGKPIDGKLLISTLYKYINNRSEN